MLNNAVRYYSRKQIDDVRNNRNLKYFAQNQLSKVTSIIISPQAIIHISIISRDSHLSFQEKPSLGHFAVFTY